MAHLLVRLMPARWIWAKFPVQRGIQYILLPVVILAVWQAASQIGFVKPIVLPPPSKVAETFYELIANGQLPKHILISILRVMEGFGIATLVGIGLGISIGLFRNLDRLTTFILQLLKPIPPIAWIPLAILWFGIGETSKVYIIFMGTFFPVMVNVIDGIRQTDQKFVELAKILEISRGKFIRQVVLPGALPSIMTGLRVGLGMAWMCVVAAELIAATRGIGYLIMDGRQLSQPEVVIVGMITIGIIGKLMDDLLKKLEQKLIVWKGVYSGD